MRQLLVFDIDNLQSEYSVIAENITLLEKGDISGFLDNWKDFLKGKVSRLSSAGKLNIRYLECPLSPRQSESSGLILSGAKDVERRYHQIFGNQGWESRKEETLQLVQGLCLREGEQFLHIEIPSVLLARLRTQEKNARPQLKDALSKRQVYYHIRITVNPESLCDLQYLALTLKRLSPLVAEKRISILLISNRSSLKYFPFCDPSNTEEKENLNKDHRLFSQYLRLLAKESTGLIFAPYSNRVSRTTDFQISIAPMNFRDTARGANFFPLIEIDENQYKRLFGTQASMEAKNKKEQPLTEEEMLSSEIRPEDLYLQSESNRSKRALFQTGNLRFLNADSPDPQKAFLAFIAETAWKRLSRSWVNEKGKDNSTTFLQCKQTILNLFTKEKNNWLTFAIFAFLVGAEEDTQPIEVQLHQAYQIAREISIGLQQLMQNAIQHSEFRSCFFTFYLDETTKKLRLFVSDINTNNTIIENFRKRLEEEIAACKDMQSEEESEPSGIDWHLFVKQHDKLVKNQQIKLAHFFNIFETQDKSPDESDIHSLWTKFRKSDSTAHIGMMIFYQTLVRAHADLTLQSTKEYQLAPNKSEIFVYKDGKTENQDNSESASERVLPGTHYLITVPVGGYRSSPVGGARISGIRNFSEDYKTFASFVDYSPKELEAENWANSVLERVKRYSVTKSADKFQIQLLWTKFWHKVLSAHSSEAQEKAVFVWHAKEINKYFSESDNIEVFLKGMFAALNSRFDVRRPAYLAIVNLHPLFLESLRNICIALVYRSFPKNIQLYFSDSSCQKYIQVFGNSMYEVIRNAVQLAIEHDSDSFRFSDTISVNQMVDLPALEQHEEPIAVMPFDALISKEISGSRTLFDEYMSGLVKYRLGVPGHHGYKLKNTHMRLGNKVHIQSFYEMSFLFYRTTIANRTAFQILRSYSKNLVSKIHTEDCMVEPILFYSYASYSKAILTSLVEMSREYVELRIHSFVRSKFAEDELQRQAIDRARAQIGFASYQHNLQSESTRDSVQLYFGISKNYTGGNLANKNGNSCLTLKRNVEVVQIVPISSTLTTFDKMFGKLKSYLNEDSSSLEYLKLSANYTALWVCDETGIEERRSGDMLFPSRIEEAYWRNADMVAQKIFVNSTRNLRELVNCPKVVYFIQESALWETPVSCSLCFPASDQLLLEVPLVETDLTSTVPAQQIREERLSARSPLEKGTVALKERQEYTENNNKRLEWLRDCVYYGHIKRGKNHHQYYINTQDFFYKDQVQRAIRDWLKDLHGEEHDKTPKLKIIFSPEHNTNVGFAQYVNTYYFEGSAEVISLNEDKVFRSNFICEHELLRQTIERIYIQTDVFDPSKSDNALVEFYFVDDTMNTGATIHKANSLVRSLLPKEQVASYPAFLFKKCFILVDRMSDATKSAYVASGQVKDFCSFVHIDISNMRVHGDSCVGCKLQKEAKRLFKRSSSRVAANYWANKYKRLSPIDYDNLNLMNSRSLKAHAYERLLLSHIAQNFIFSDGIDTRGMGEYYDCILVLFNLIFQRTDRGVLSKNAKCDNFLFESLLLDLLKDGSQNIKGKKLKERQVLIAELLLKLLARPFFSFDSSFRLQMLSFLLGLAECSLSWYVEEQGPGRQGDISKWHSSCISKLSSMIPEKDRYKGFLRKNGRIEKTVLIAEQFLQSFTGDTAAVAHFFKDVLFEALADMRSTYLLRKSVITRVCQFVDNYLSASNGKLSDRVEALSCNECPYLLDSTQCKKHWEDNCFWITYCAHVQRLVDSTSDEVRATWFDYLLFSGEELNKQNRKEMSESLISSTANFPGVQQIVSSKAFPVAAELLLSTAVAGFDIMEKIVENPNITNHSLINYFYIMRWLDQETGAFHFQEGNLLYSGLGGDRENSDVKNQCQIVLSAYKAFFSILNQTDKYSSKNALRQNGLKVPHTSEQYQEFLNRLVDFVACLNRVDNGAFNAALLTMSKDEDIAAIDRIQIVQDRFGQDTTASQDKRRARYIIKDRVACAFNGKETTERTVGLLKETGYFMNFASTSDDSEYEQAQQQIKYDDQHHVVGNHRKPYLVLLFDNPDFEDFHTSPIGTELGRKLVPLNHVFLYISIHVKEGEKRDKLPWLILRDILAYRNRIMRFLTNDFNSDIMEQHAASMQEEVILTHERSASHASTADEKGIARVFGLSSISAMKVLRYPVDLETYKIMDDGDPNSKRNSYSAVFWLLLQNYTNSQIARLFSRQFNSQDREWVKRDGVPPLYLSKEDEQEEDIFKQRLTRFDEIYILPKVKRKDNRFILVKEAASIQCLVDPAEKLYYNQKSDEYYNAEYMRCILLDIIFSSFKYATVNDSLLPRIDNLIYYKKRSEDEGTNSAFQQERRRWSGCSAVKCNIIIFKSGRDLVILNNVKPNALKGNIEDTNEEIYRRIHDVLDYGDGHMSLFTIRQFVLKIMEDENQYSGQGNGPDVSFRYVKKEDIDGQYKNHPKYLQFANTLKEYDIWFETKLPIFEGVSQNGEQ